MQVFDPESFRQFLGQPTWRKNHNWGLEERYVVSESSLAEHELRLRDTLYHHHSSFDVYDEIRALGYPLAALAMRQRDSGNPSDETTQMGNLGEVVGTEFARAFLGFETTWVLPKRLNPNVDQSMKGVDIIGLRGANQPPELLVGEAKSGKRFNRDAIDEAYDHLVALHVKEAPRMLRHIKESLRLQGDRFGPANVDRHMADGVPRHCLIFSLTQTEPRSPFEIITEKSGNVQLPHLMAVHVQICNLRGENAENDLHSEKTWLSRLFTP